MDSDADFDSDQLKKDDRSASGAAQKFVANLPEPPVGLSGRDVDFENYLDLATGTRAPDLTELSKPDPDDTRGVPVRFSSVQRGLGLNSEPDWAFGSGSSSNSELNQPEPVQGVQFSSVRVRTSSQDLNK
jgi:hypothetical protein